MSFGFFLSTVVDTSIDAIKLCIGATMSHMFLTGIVWPLEGIPPWLRAAVWYLPHTAGVQGMRDIMLRGWGIGSPSVLQGMLIPLGWILFFLLLSWILMMKKMK